MCVWIVGNFVNCLDCFHIHRTTQDIRDVSLQSVRRTVGVIPQETLLFNDTLGYNIAYGDMNASPEQVQEVIERAKLSHVVKQLPQGLESIVGERGMKLSGGEKQRGRMQFDILRYYLSWVLL